jgi:CubicO group peptidase (beta-lactamase class C family)
MIALLLPPLLFAGLAAAVEPRSPRIDEALDQVVAGFRVERLRPGYGLCLFGRRGPIWSNYQGFADEESGEPFSERTRFRAGAISEIVTAVRILQLADRGTIDLDRPVRTYLPEVFDGAPPGSSLARIGDLPIRTILAHLSGSTANYFLGFQGYRPLQNIRPFLLGTSFRFPPGTKYLHASGLIDLLGPVIEKLEGKSFQAAVQDGIFVPLGMASSSFQYRDSPLNASIRYKSGPTDSYVARLPDFRDVQAPSGSLQSSLEDLVTFYSALLGDGAAGERPILSPGTRAEMFSSKSDRTARLQGIRVGYVWMLSSPELAHLGDIAWYSGKFLSHRNVVILARDLGIGVACATNSWHILERDTIFPLAAAVLERYAALAFDRRPSPGAPSVTRSPPERIRKGLSGTYVSPYGVYVLESKGGSMVLSTNGSYSRLTGCGTGSLCSIDEGEILEIDATAPDAISVTLKTGAVVEAARISASAHSQTWRKHLGTYRIGNPSDLKEAHLFAFTIGSRGKALVISGDDAVECLLTPVSDDRAEVACNEGSLFFEKTLTVKSPREMLLGRVKYRK